MSAIEREEYITINIGRCNLKLLDYIVTVCSELLVLTLLATFIHNSRLGSNF